MNWKAFILPESQSKVLCFSSNDDTLTEAGQGAASPPSLYCVRCHLCQGSGDTMQLLTWRHCQGPRVKGFVWNSFKTCFEACLPWVSRQEVLQRQFQNCTSNCIHPKIKCNTKLLWSEFTKEEFFPCSLPCIPPAPHFSRAQKSQLEGRRLLTNCFLERVCFSHWKHLGEGCKEKGPKCDLNKGHHSFTKNCSLTQNSQQLGVCMIIQD